MLAKNPAGWSELLDLVAGSGSPLVIGINARTADGTDPSWLWDVPFERLAGRAVVATGERVRDLAVRLLYAGVNHVAEPDPLRAVTLAADEWAPSAAEEVRATGAVQGDLIDVIGNYTAFYDFLRAPA
jgi:UDP-N-acetylmuramyl tripeptide synthase